MICQLIMMLALNEMMLALNEMMLALNEMKSPRSSVDRAVAF